MWYWVSHHDPADDPALDKASGEFFYSKNSEFKIQIFFMYSSTLVLYTLLVYK